MKWIITIDSILSTEYNMLFHFIVQMKIIYGVPYLPLLIIELWIGKIYGTI